MQQEEWWVNLRHNYGKFRAIKFFAAMPASTSRSPNWSSLAKSAMSAGLAAGALTAGQAQALVVSVPGYGHWDVTTFTGSYDDNTTKFAQLPAPGVMPWWGSQTAALAFANAVRNQLPPSGICSACTPPTAAGPYFGYGTDGSINEPIELSYFQYLSSSPEIGGAVSVFRQGNFSFVWAQASPATTPAPGPLPALGIAAAFSYSRLLKMRIKGEK
ncbi:MAG: hypothetical protein WCL59_06140 [Cyanobium sp. ELA507]